MTIFQIVSTNPAKVYATFIPGVSIGHENVSDAIEVYQQEWLKHPVGKNTVLIEVFSETTGEANDARLEFFNGNPNSIFCRADFDTEPTTWKWFANGHAEECRHIKQALDLARGGAQRERRWLIATPDGVLNPKQEMAG